LSAVPAIEVPNGSHFDSPICGYAVLVWIALKLVADPAGKLVVPQPSGEDLALPKKAWKVDGGVRACLLDLAEKSHVSSLTWHSI